MHLQSLGICGLRLVDIHVHVSTLLLRDCASLDLDFFYKPSGHKHGGAE